MASHSEVGSRIDDVEDNIKVELTPVTLPSRQNHLSTNTDPFEVRFATPYDAGNPLDWRTSRKWMITFVLSATGLNRIMISTIMAPALPTMANELDMSASEAAMSLSIYILASIIGPLLMGPLSELYGRRPILHASNIWFLVWNLVCGFATNKAVLLLARFLAGFGASAIYALAGGVLGDIWRPEQRGRSLSLYLLIPLLGAAVGPIVGGYVVALATWRWIFWATSIFQGVMTLVSIFAFPECYGPFILERRVKDIRRQTSNDKYYAQNSRRDTCSSSLAHIAGTIARPIRFLTFHPTIQISALLLGFDYGILYIVLTTLAEVWILRYHQSAATSGLHYIAPTLGEICASLLGGVLMDWLYQRQRASSPEPEHRLLLALPATVLGWTGAILYGWTAQFRVYWLAVDAGVFVTTFGQQLAGMPLTAYVIDIYGEHTSSAMAAIQFVKSLTAFLFPLFAPSMYHALGYGWSNSMLALIGLVLSLPAIVVLQKYGANYRAKKLQHLSSHPSGITTQTNKQTSKA